MGHIGKDLIVNETKIAFRLYFSILASIVTLSPKGVFKAAAEFRQARDDFFNRKTDADQQRPSVIQK